MSMNLDQTADKITPTSGTLNIAATSILGTNGTVMVSGNMPAFSYYQSVAQTLSNNTATKITFTSQIFDTTGGMYASSRFTPTVSGYYQINGRVGIATTATNSTIYIYKNGSEYARGNDIASSCYGVTMSNIVYLNGSTDYVEIYFSALVGQNTDARQVTTWFSGCMVRSA